MRAVVLSAPFLKAWTGATAVEVWTRDRYFVSASPYVREFHVAIRPGDRLGWERYLQKAGVSTKARKRVGAVVRLWPDRELAPVLVRGEPVISRDSTEALIRSVPSTYASAGDLIPD